jgi:hypothetical protein
LRSASPLVYGCLGYVFGGAAAAVLVELLVMAVGTSGDPRGGETVFKIAWSAAVFGIGPSVAVAVPLAIGRRLDLEGLVLPLSVGNDCRVGVKWPVTSVPGCD